MLDKTDCVFVLGSVSVELLPFAFRLSSGFGLHAVGLVGISVALVAFLVARAAFMLGDLDSVFIEDRDFDCPPCSGLVSNLCIPSIGKALLVGVGFKSVGGLEYSRRSLIGYCREDVSCYVRSVVVHANSTCVFQIEESSHFDALASEDLR